jgi:hypothetical protein
MPRWGSRKPPIFVRAAVHFLGLRHVLRCAPAAWWWLDEATTGRTPQVAHTLRRCGAGIREPDLANIADILLRVALGIIVFPTDRLETSDPAAVRDRAARYLVPIIGKAGY